MRTTSARPDRQFHVQWTASPFADAYLGRFAASLVESLKLGQHDGTDFLGVSFSTPAVALADFDCDCSSWRVASAS